MIYEVEICEAPNSTTIYKPKGPKSSPGILLLHGSEGGWSGWSHVKALWFAQYGFTAYPFPYSLNGDIWNAGDIVDVELDKTEEALFYLRDEMCEGHRVGLYGGSRGGEHALLLASLMSADKNQKWVPDAVAVHSPADVVCGAFRAAWCREGKEQESFDPSALAWKWRGSTEGLTPSTPIKIGDYGGPLYISHGTNDMVWSCDMTRRLEKRLIKAGRKPEVHYYEGQGHGFDHETNNIRYKRLVDFFTKHLCAE